MTLARLDNQVFFKKAFGDPIVFRAFVRDIVGIEVNPSRIETEKSFAPKAGSIDFKYDVFAEDDKKRVIVEIQKVEYDHNFDRFLHYHLQAITEQQRHSEEYAIHQTVYTIVVITAPYKTKMGTGEVIRDEVLISTLNPKNLKGLERKIYNHELIFLNPNFKGEDTPTNYRDWLDLIYESIHNPENPVLNLSNLGVKRVTELLNVDNISPEEWGLSKIEAGRKIVLEQTWENGLEEGVLRKARIVAKKLKSRGMSSQDIAEDTGLSIEEIESL
jgi:predicted transposase/invertase (TIGR01784 family)